LQIFADKLVLFSVLVLHWVTHQDEEGMDSRTRCEKCNRTLGGGQYSLGSSNVVRGGVDHSLQRPFGGQVITNCTSKKTDVKDKSIPLEGILTRTEFTRDVESMGGNSSEVDLNNKRDSSTDHIRDIRDPPA
jgi:ribosomal protein L34E